MKKAIKERILPFFKKNLIIALIVIMVIVGLSVSKLNVNTVDKLGKSMQPDEEDKQIIVQAMLPEPAETKLITAN